MATTADVSTAQKLLVYDGDCPMCRATVDLVVRLGLVRTEQTVSNHDVDAATLDRARHAGIRNQLVVIESATGTTRSGTDGLLWIALENQPRNPLVRLLALPGLRRMLSWGYQIISYNRRVISPPRQQIVCDCEPEVTVARRLSLVVPLVVFAVAVFALFGAAMFVGGDLGEPILGALLLLAAAGAPWLATTLAALVLAPAGQKLDTVAHMSVVAVTGSLLLLPAAAIAWWLPTTAALGLCGVSLVAAAVTMFLMLRYRLRVLNRSSAWLWGWSAAVIASAAAAASVYFASGNP